MVGGAKWTSGCLIRRGGGPAGSVMALGEWGRAGLGKNACSSVLQRIKKSLFVRARVWCVRISEGRAKASGRERSIGGKESSHEWRELRRKRTRAKVSSLEAVCWYFFLAYCT